MYREPEFNMSLNVGVIGATKEDAFKMLELLCFYDRTENNIFQASTTRGKVINYNGSVYTALSIQSNLRGYKFDQILYDPYIFSVHKFESATELCDRYNLIEYRLYDMVISSRVPEEFDLRVLQWDW